MHLRKKKAQRVREIDKKLNRCIFVCAVINCKIIARFLAADLSDS